MKKNIVCFMLFISVLFGNFITVGALNIGDPIDKVVYSGISAYINHYPIESFAYDGGTVVVVEDLRYYGFDVIYNDEAKSLNIVPNRNVTKLNVEYYPFKNELLSGRLFSNVLYSDINVYLNGSWIPSCAVRGCTMVKLEDLVSETDGISYTWDNSTRSAKLWLDWVNIQKYVPLKENTDNYRAYRIVNPGDKSTYGISIDYAITLALEAMYETKREYVTVYDYGDSYQIWYSEPIWIDSCFEFSGRTCWVDKATGYVHDIAG